MADDVGCVDGGLEKAMNPENRRKIKGRVEAAAEAALTRQGYASAIDVLVGIGWLEASAVARWRKGQTQSLERVVLANLSRVTEAMKLFRAWGTAKKLKPSETAYVAKVPGRPPLRFSVSGNATIERLYRTHWVSPALSAKKRERLAEGANRGPESVVEVPEEVGEETALGRL